MEAMYNDRIELTSGRDEENDWRIPRLHRVLGYVCAMADQAGIKGTFDKIEQLNDHKGDLTVSWTTNPTEEEKGFFAKAWASIIGDGCDNVRHELV